MCETDLGERVKLTNLVIVDDVPNSVYLSDYVEMTEKVEAAADKHPDLYGYELGNAIFDDLIGEYREGLRCGVYDDKDQWGRLLWYYSQYVAKHRI